MTARLRALETSPAAPPAAVGLTMLALGLAFWTGDTFDYAFLSFAAYLLVYAALLLLPGGPGRRSARVVRALNAVCLLAFCASGVLFFWGCWASSAPAGAALFAAGWGANLARWRPVAPRGSTPVGRSAVPVASPGARAAAPEPDGDDEVIWL